MHHRVVLLLTPKYCPICIDRDYGFNSSTIFRSTSYIAHRYLPIKHDSFWDNIDKFFYFW